jgi:hypothetical protein
MDGPAREGRRRLLADGLLGREIAWKSVLGWESGWCVCVWKRMGLMTETAVRGDRRAFLWRSSCLLAALTSFPSPCMFAPRIPRRGIQRTCVFCRRLKSKGSFGKRETTFPHGFSATEPLVPPSADGSTPLTDALPRSLLLDPTTYARAKNKEPRQPPLITIDPKDRMASELEERLLHNPFGNCH